MSGADVSDRRADVVIIGAGVIGLTCAIELLAEGRSVIVVDRAKPGSGSSHGNCGTITPSHAAPLAAPGMVATALRWLFTPDAPLRIKPRFDPALLHWLLAFAARCNDRDHDSVLATKAPFLSWSRGRLESLIGREGLASDFSTPGTRVVYHDPRNLDAAQRELDALRALGIESIVVDADATLRDEPALKPGIAGSVVYPGDAQLRPDRHVAELARVVRERGGTIVEDAEVIGLDVAGTRVERMSTADGSFVGDDVVLALGAWSPWLARQLGVRLPIQPGKGYSITWTRPALAPGMPMTLKEPSVCVTAWRDGFRLGSTMEFAGYDETLNKVRLDALRRAANAFLIEPVGPEQVEEWFGWRPMTTDDLPIIGRAPGIDNVVVATGHGMLGMTMSAGTAEVVADVVCRRAPRVDIAAFDPVRFR